MGHRWRRRDVRHRVPGTVANGRVGRRYQGPRPRYAGLFEYRWAGLDRLVRWAGHEAVRFRRGAARPTGAAQGAGPDPRRARRGVRRPDHTGPHQPLLPDDHGRQRVPGAGRCHRLHGVHAGTWHRRRCGDTPVEACGRLAGVPAVHLRPTTGRAHQRAVVVAGQSGSARGLVAAPGRGTRRLPRIRPNGRAIRAPLRDGNTHAGDPGDTGGPPRELADAAGTCRDPAS